MAVASCHPNAIVPAINPAPTMVRIAMSVRTYATVNFASTRRALLTGRTSR
jgi:hypothetical protein